MSTHEAAPVGAAASAGAAAPAREAGPVSETGPGSDAEPARAAPTAPTVPARSARKRQAIIAAATELFLRHGYLGTSMDQVTAAAAVSKPTVYKFFADKEQLFTEIVLGTLERAGGPVLARVELLARATDVATDPATDLDTGLRALARDYLAAVTQPNVLQLRRLVIGASHQLPSLARAYYERAPEKTMDALAGCFGQLTARGLLRCPDERMAAAHFAFLVLGRALDKSLFCGDQPFSAAELTAQADAGTTAFLAAYGTGSTRAVATVSQSSA
jgi:TetR/AcrR family transcriptional repressor of mexJK operon